MSPNTFIIQHLTFNIPVRTFDERAGPPATRYPPPAVLATIRRPNIPLAEYRGGISPHSRRNYEVMDHASAGPGDDCGLCRLFRPRAGIASGERGADRGEPRPSRSGFGVISRRLRAHPADRWVVRVRSRRRFRAGDVRPVAKSAGASLHARDLGADL